MMEDFCQEIARYFKLTIPGKMSSFEEVFKFLLDMAERKPCTIVIDEFQEFVRVNPSVFSVMQRDWDRKKRSAKVNLIVSGKALEDYYQHKFAESGKFTKIGNWWDRKGQNEIDIVAIDELTKTISFCEVKRNGERIDLNALSEKAEAFHRATGDYTDYHADYLALPMSEM